MIHSMPLRRYMENGMDGMQMMLEEFKVETEGMVLPSKVRWLANATASGSGARTEKLLRHR